MAALYIWEFSETMVRDGTQVPRAPGILQQLPVPLSNTSAQSSPFNAATAYILISTDQICSIAIGSNPVATTNSFRLPQGVWPLPIAVNPGDRIAAISNV